MNPDVALATILDLIAEAEQATNNEDAALLYGEAGEHFKNLDKWLRRGGHPPVAWKPTT